MISGSDFSDFLCILQYMTCMMLIHCSIANMMYVIDRGQYIVISANDEAISKPHLTQ